MAIFVIARRASNYSYEKPLAAFLSRDAANDALDTMRDCFGVDTTSVEILELEVFTHVEAVRAVSPTVAQAAE
jgi:hypothetical protein